MAELKENQLVFVDENQNEVLCDILFTYESEEFGKSYVFFSPVSSEDEDGNREVAVASFKQTEEGMGELEPVETDEEWDLLEEVLASYIDDSECECGCCGDDCECECGDDCECECGEECECEEEHEEGCHCCCGHHHK